MQHRFFANIVWQDVYEKKVCIWPLCPSLDHIRVCIHINTYVHTYDVPYMDGDHGMIENMQLLGGGVGGPLEIPETWDIRSS